MRFYWYILLIVVFINAILLFTSIGEYTKNLEINFFDPTLILFSVLFFILLVTAFTFAVVKTTVS